MNRIVVVGIGCCALAAVAVRQREIRRRCHDVGGQVRHLSGRLAGAEYRWRGGHPDEDVDDLVLADRIRSTIGPLEHALDQPRINVAVHRHVATLHGDVATDYAADRLVHAVRSVSGVADVDSHLHVGLVPGDACPSAALDH